MEKSKVRRITYGGYMIALVFSVTAFVPHIPIAFTEGYINIGDSIIFIAAILFGWKYGAIAGGIGSSLADLYLGFPHWALPTLIIKGVMGAIVGFMAKDSKDRKFKITKRSLSFLVLIVWMILLLFLKRFLINYIGEFENLVGMVQLVLTLSLTVIPISLLVIFLYMNKKNKGLYNLNNFLGMSIAGLWMVIGYYISGGILKGNMIVPIFSIPANILQFVFSIIVALPLVMALKKVGIKL